MTKKKDSVPNDETKTFGVATESENSFFTTSGSSPTTGNGSSGRPPVPTPTESGHLINEAYKRYRIAPNSSDARNDLFREIRNYAERVLSKECTFKGWTSVRLNTDDVIQNALLKIWKGLNTFRSESKFSTWCYRIILRAVSDTSRSIHQGEVELLPWKPYAEYCGTAHGGCTGSAPDSGNAKDRFTKRVLNEPCRQKDNDGGGPRFGAKPLLPKRFLQQEQNRLIADIDFQAVLDGLNPTDSQIGELFFVSGYTALEIAEELGKDTTRAGHKCSPGERWVQNRIAAIRIAFKAGALPRGHDSGRARSKTGESFVSRIELEHDLDLKVRLALIVPSRSPEGEADPFDGGVLDASSNNGLRKTCEVQQLVISMFRASE